MKRLSVVILMSLTALLVVPPVIAQSILTLRAENDVPGPVIIEVFTAGDLSSPLVSRGLLTFAGNDNSCSNQSLSIPSNQRRVRFVFTNDFFTGTGFEQPTDADDRNAIIDSFTIDGALTQGENFSSVFPTPALLTAACGGTAVAVGVTGGYAEYVLAAPAVPGLSLWGTMLLVTLLGLASAYTLRRSTRREFGGVRRL